ncbi:S-methyl-5-thioribose-1-phosphate isomerase [uncultured Thermanaerothrix sp.]|uniref:S-methyl-5-thioribose-1-phosphate isomerase n=1 Tax=uncultured Thermanaerothrix sp. TaxID=1195149 RepID=UPI002621E999|nr:S-methyl-5-thioribose-1-phosphate isomerase [uncultured Thermanaerothrix sp.]
MAPYRTLEWRDNTLVLLDQRLLPHTVHYVTLSRVEEVAEAIRNMTVRGAPAIGATAAYGMALAALHSPSKTPEELRTHLEKAATLLKASRPTAVNLAWAVDRILSRVNALSTSNPAQIFEAVLNEAHTIADEDIRTNRQIGLNALPLLPPKVTFIHHCNTGALATVDYGTALGIIRTAHEHGHEVFVYVDETRPRLQGARLTAWELQQLGIPFQIIVDGASGFVMRTRKVDAVVVGCDRVAANGDTANKIGTYNLALAARAHGVPLYVAAPTSTIDLSLPNGDAIPIEERSEEEIIAVDGHQIAPLGATAYNPAFDVTPAQYITAIITEVGIAYPPYEQSLRQQVEQAKTWREQFRRPDP